MMTKVVTVKDRRKSALSRELQEKKRLRNLLKKLFESYGDAMQVVVRKDKEVEKVIEDLCAIEVITNFAIALGDNRSVRGFLYKDSSLGVAGQILLGKCNKIVIPCKIDESRRNVEIIAYLKRPKTF